MPEKSALITGACGFSAPWVIQKLLDQGWKVRATDMANAPRKGLKRFGDKIEFIPGDITKPETLKPLVEGIDVCFHPAAIFSYSAPMDILRKVNVQGTQNMIEACMKSDVKKMVLWSSVALYGTADPKFYKIPITEDQPLNPKNDGKYDESKREQEQAARKYWEENKFPVSFMRCAPLYGSGSYYGIYILMKYIKEEVLSFAPNNLHNGSVPLVHAEDVARTAIHLSDPTKYNGEAYNVVDDNNLDMIETFKFIANLTDSNFKPIIPIWRKLMIPLFKIIGAWSRYEAIHLRKKVNGKPPIPKLETDTIIYMFGNYYFSNKKLKDTGFSLKYPDRRIGLVETIKWYNENGWDRDLAIKGIEQMKREEVA